MLKYFECDDAGVREEKLLRVPRCCSSWSGSASVTVAAGCVCKSLTADLLLN